MLDRLDHVTVAVKNLAAAQRSYVSLLGRSPCWQDSHPVHGARGVRFRLDNSQIELATPEGEGARGDDLREQLEARGEGVHAIALGTPDLAATCATLRNGGLAVPNPEPGISQDGPSGAWLRWQQCAIPRDRTGGVRIQMIESRSLEEEVPPSLAIGEEASAAGRLDHVVIFSDCADETRELYGETLGIRLALDKEFSKRRVRLLFFRLGGATIEIGASLNGNTPAKAGASADRDRLWGLAYQVANIEGAHSRMLKAGLELAAVRDGHKPGTRVFEVKESCHGVPTLMIQPVSR